MKSLNVGWATLGSKNWNQVFAQTNKECLTLLWRSFGRLVSSLFSFSYTGESTSCLRSCRSISADSGPDSDVLRFRSFWVKWTLRDHLTTGHSPSGFQQISISVGKADQTHPNTKTFPFIKGRVSLTPNTETFVSSVHTSLGDHRDVSGQCETILSVLFALQCFSPLASFICLDHELTEACSSLMLF